MYIHIQIGMRMPRYPRTRKSRYALFCTWCRKCPSPSHSPDRRNTQGSPNNTLTLNEILKTPQYLRQPSHASHSAKHRQGGWTLTAASFSHTSAMSCFLRLNTACRPTTVAAALNNPRRGKVSCTNDQMRIRCLSRGNNRMHQMLVEGRDHGEELPWAYPCASSFVLRNYRFLYGVCGNFDGIRSDINLSGIIFSAATNYFSPHCRLADQIPFISYHRQLRTDARKSCTNVRWQRSCTQACARCCAFGNMPKYTQACNMYPLRLHTWH